MKRNIVVAFIVFLVALLVTSIAWAHGGHYGPPGPGFAHQRGFAHGYAHRPRTRVDVVIGGAWHYGPYPRYYVQPPYYVYAYPPVIAMQSPPVYIERSGPQQQQQQPQLMQPTQPWWYYCENPQGYYPYVRVCPNGWQQVPAQPPPEPR
jgi:hypothetical protein